MAGKILVVHRNELILDVIQEMLQNIGCAVTLATDGHQALAKALSEHFSLIIIDRNLTGDFDGVQLVERLRKYGIRTPIIGTAPETTWASSTESATQAVDHFLPAPFGYSELINAAETLLNRTLVEPTPLETLSAAAYPAPPSPPEPPPVAPEQNTETVHPPLQTTDRSSGHKRWEPRHIAKPEGPPRILVVDNNDTDREQVAERLTRAGYDVTSIKGGQDAYEATMLNDYELILTDLWLVGLDGFEMVEAMRKSGVTSPIAVLTAYITRDMVQELLESCICKVLLKPVEPNALLSFVQKTARVLVS